jgi:ABC-type phosphate/phosphonate transport system substrate-binding protein
MESLGAKTRWLVGEKTFSYGLAKEYLTKGLEELREGLRPFIERVLIERDGKEWHQHPRIQRIVSVQAQEYAEKGPSLDIALLLRIIGSEANWQRTFRNKLPGTSLWMIDSLRDLRNRIAHDDGSDPLFKNRQLTLQLLNNMHLILDAAKCEQARAIEELILMLNPSARNKAIRLLTGRSRWSIPAAGLVLTAAITTGLVEQHKLSPKVDNPVITIGTPDPKAKEYQQLTQEIEKRLRRKSLIDHLMGKRVEVRLEKANSYPEAMARVKNHEWQILFGYSPVVSMLAVEVGYRGIAVMFSDNPNYRSLFFAKRDSAIIDLNSVNRKTRVALGDPYSASKYYVPISILKGRKMTIIENNSTSEIVSLVKNGKADIGVIAGSRKDFQAKHKDLKVISTSNTLPQSIVAVSPYVSDNDRITLQKVLLSIPQNARNLGKADYGPGAQPSYGVMRRIVELAKSLSACIKAETGETIIACPKDSEITTYDGWIDEITPYNSHIDIRVGTTSGNSIILESTRELLNKVTIFETLENLKNRRVRINVVRGTGKNRGVYALTSPNQISFED